MAGPYVHTEGAARLRRVVRGSARTEESPLDEDAPKPRLAIFFVALALMAFVITFGAPLVVAYRAFGPTFFVPAEIRKMGLTPEAWHELLRNRTVVMIGGHHRGGTSVLWECLREHPGVSHFGDPQESGMEHSEGMFVQNVYPHFGIGREHQHGHAWRPYGLGRFALAPEDQVHWTDAHERVTPAWQAELLNSWGPFWDLGAKPVLLEKSPPNAVVSTFLQALINQGNPGWAPTPPAFGGASPRVAFVFISRHPIANAYALRVAGHCKLDPLGQLVGNWLAIHGYLDTDLPRLQRARTLRLEDFAQAPARHVAELWQWIGLPPDPASAARATAKVNPSPNAKYRKAHCEWLASDRAWEEYSAMADELNSKVAAVRSAGSGYSLLDGEWTCGRQARGGRQAAPHEALGR